MAGSGMLSGSPFDAPRRLADGVSRVFPGGL